jgi:hypothetical protein
VSNRKATNVSSRGRPARGILRSLPIWRRAHGDECDAYRSTGVATMDFSGAVSAAERSQVSDASAAKATGWYWRATRVALRPQGEAGFGLVVTASTSGPSIMAPARPSDGCQAMGARVTSAGRLANQERSRRKGCWPMASARDDPSEAWVSRRANALDDGWSCEELAAALLMDDDMVRSWHKLYVERGIAALVVFHQGGSEGHLTCEQETELVEWVRATLPRRDLQRLLQSGPPLPAPRGIEKLDQVLRFGHGQLPRHQSCPFSGFEGVGVPDRWCYRQPIREDDGKRSP